MNLFTIHKTDFDITTGVVDWDKSEMYMSFAGFARAYQWLASKLGTNQYIWTYYYTPQLLSSYLYHSPLKKDEVVWLIDVDTTDVLTIVDFHAWHHVIGNYYYTKSDQSDDEFDRTWNLPQDKKEQSWNDIFISIDAFNRVSAPQNFNILINFPISTDKVVNKIDEKVATTIKMKYNPLG